MKSVNTSGLMLGMLAVGGLIAGGAFMTGQAVFAIVGEDPDGGLTVDPTNAAAAANNNNQPVTQTNAAAIGQESHTKCKASVSDDDVAQVGSNTNTAANDCDTTQSANVGQENTNTQTTTQDALAIACQTLAFGSGSNGCGDGGSIGGGDGGGEGGIDWCHVDQGQGNQETPVKLTPGHAMHELDHAPPCHDIHPSA